ncbi:MAG: hypothetical protein QUV05_01385 [Phycisphaerae bacterium]|nr:hypothetical protein [Phycisphaerae bacterium]
MKKKSLCLTLGLAIIALVTAPAAGQLTNGDWETGNTTGWVAGANPLPTVHGAGWFWDAGPHTGNYGAGTASQGGVSANEARQNIAPPQGAGYYTLTLTFWAEIVVGHSSTDPFWESKVEGELWVDGVLVGSDKQSTVNGVPIGAGQWAQKQINFYGLVNTSIEVRMKYRADGRSSGTIPQAYWAVVTSDDIVLNAVKDADTQHQVFSITPDHAMTDLPDTNATLTGINLDGVNVVNLVGPTTIVGTSINPVGPGYEELTVTFPTTGKPCGIYDLVVQKPGEETKTLEKAFWLLNPNSADNLLLNGGFEDPNGNSQDWYGIYERDGTVHNPDPLVVEGTHKYSVALTPTNLHLDRGFWQVVAVPAGPVFFEGYVSVGPGTLATNTATIRIYDGRGTGGTLLDEFTVDETTERVLYDTKPVNGWARVTLSGNSTAGDITIEVDCSLDSGPDFTGDSYAAVHLDGFRLMTCESCSTQHTLTPGQTWQATDDEDPQLVITGTNMLEVTGVRLVQIGGTGSFIYSENLYNRTATSLTADFDWPVAGAPLGTYTVITEQAAAGSNCPSQYLDDALTIACFDPTSFTTAPVSPSSLTKPQPATVELTVSGANIDKLDEVKLVWTPEPRPAGDRAPYWVPTIERIGTLIDASDPSNVVYSFDLVNAQAGKYKLVGTRNDVCGSPSEVLDAFELLLPEGDNIVVDGGFEDASSAWVLTPDPENTQKGDPMPGVSIAYTDYVGDGDPGNYGYPKISGIDPPYTGDEVLFARGGNYLAGCYSFAYHSDDPDLDYATWVSPNNGKVSQSLGLPNGPGNYELVMTYWVRIWDQLWVGSSLKASIIVDGVEASSTTIAFPGYGKASQDGNDPYTQLSVDFIGAAMSDITVEFYFQTKTVEADYADSAATTAIAIDDVAVFGALACGDPFADADKDGDVDQADFAMMQACYTGSGGDVSDECRCFDRKDSPGSLPDSDVDNTDMASFEDCASGPGIAADPTCDDDN